MTEFAKAFGAAVLLGIFAGVFALALGFAAHALVDLVVIGWQAGGQ